jgi:hypothetical protein
LLILVRDSQNTDQNVGKATVHGRGIVIDCTRLWMAALPSYHSIVFASSIDVFGEKPCRRFVTEIDEIGSDNRIDSDYIATASTVAFSQVCVFRQRILGRWA